MKIKKFEELNIWKLALKITKEIYGLTAKKEFTRDFNSSDQIRKSIISVSSNMVEGFEKNNNGSIRFLKIANGSVGETRNQLYIALTDGYITNQEFEKINKELEELTNQIGSFIVYLEKRKKSFQLDNSPTQKSLSPNSSTYQLKNKGIIITYVLVFGTIFLLLLGGLLGFILFQLRQSAQKLAWNQSLHIAEAGLNYYRWCLNNEVEANCQKEKDYYDSAGNLIGHFSLVVSSQQSCGRTTRQEITSTGWNNKFPDIKRKITAFYARESLAKFSYLLNDNVWVGSDHEIRGPYHSNGGVRFDGENQSTVSSAKDSWLCTSSFGCSYLNCPSDCAREGSSCRCPGVFTTTQVSNPDLFEWPVPSFDFAGITIDLAQMKNIAQASGIYLPPSTHINSQGKGWHLKFRENGTFEAWLITKLSPTYAYSLEEGWHYDYFTITNEFLYNTYTIPSTCSVIFVEDNLWPEGIVKRKTAVASANLINPNLDTDVILQANIDYSVRDGSDGLLLIGERNVLIGPNSPNQMELRGIFVAQKGRFSRNHYPGNFRDKLEIYGSIISNGRVGTKWTSGGQVISGYQKRESYFDANLIYWPPVFTPYLSSDFKLTGWQEIK